MAGKEPPDGDHLPRGSSKKLLKLTLACLADAKAEDVTTIALKGKSDIADHMVICSGRSHRHVGAIADQLGDAVRDAGYARARVEGLPHCDWVLLDLNDLIVHILRPEVREFYNLEKLWSVSLSKDKMTG